MRLRLIRHATLVIEFGGRKLIVDPMLDAAGARPAAVPDRGDAVCDRPQFDSPGERARGGGAGGVGMSETKEKRKDSQALK